MDHEHDVNYVYSFTDDDLDANFDELNDDKHQSCLVTSNIKIMLINIEYYLT